MVTIDVNINSTKSALDYVKYCEASLEKTLSDTAELLMTPTAPRIITVCGPTCSGKTTASAKITDLLNKNGYRTKVLSIDDFYKDNIRESENPDFESANSIDLDYFGECVAKLFNMEKVCLPTFDMKEGVRAQITEYLPSKDDIYFFEGIQAVYPEVTSVLEPFGFKSIYISVADDIMANGVLLSRNDVRLFRRLVRDEKFRATNALKTFRMWKDVQSNEFNNIFPFASKADYKINSFLPYELFIVGKYLIPSLTNTSLSEFASLGDAIIDRLSTLTNDYITEDMIPSDSLFREFIG